MLRHRTQLHSALRGWTVIGLTIRHKAAALVVGPVAAFVLVIVLAARSFASPDASGHAFFHLMGGIPFALAGGLLWADVPRASGVRGAARGLVVGGLLIMGLGSFAESIGAFAWVDEEVGFPMLQVVHTVSAVVSPLGMPLVGAGVLAIIVRAVPRWRGSRAARIAVGAAGGLAALALVLSLFVPMGVRVLD